MTALPDPQPCAPGLGSARVSSDDPLDLRSTLRLALICASVATAAHLVFLVLQQSGDVLASASAWLHPEVEAGGNDPGVAPYGILAMISLFALAPLTLGWLAYTERPSWWSLLIAPLTAFFAVFTYSLVFLFFLDLAWVTASRWRLRDSTSDS